MAKTTQLRFEWNGPWLVAYVDNEPVWSHHRDDWLRLKRLAPKPQEWEQTDTDGFVEGDPSV